MNNDRARLKTYSQSLETPKRKQGQISQISRRRSDGQHFILKMNWDEIDDEALLAATLAAEQRIADRNPTQTSAVSSSVSQTTTSAAPRKLAAVIRPAPSSLPRCKCGNEARVAQVTKQNRNQGICFFFDAAAASLARSDCSEPFNDTLFCYCH